MVNHDKFSFKEIIGRPFDGYDEPMMVLLRLSRIFARCCSAILLGTYHPTFFQLTEIQKARMLNGFGTKFVLA